MSRHIVAMSAEVVPDGFLYGASFISFHKNEERGTIISLTFGSDAELLQFVGELNPGDVAHLDLPKRLQRLCLNPSPEVGRVFYFDTELSERELQVLSQRFA